MEKNIDNTGRVIRFCTAFLLLVYAFVAWSWIALAIGIFVLYEAFASWCVLYQILGINRCPLDKK